MKKIFLSLVFLSVGIGLSIYGKKVLDNAKESVKWPKTNGKIISSKVDRRRSTSGTGSQKKTTIKYYAIVNYDYYLNNKTFTSDNVYFGQGGSSNRSKADSIVGKYPAGLKVSVYYKPDNHEIAVLEPGATWSSYMLLFMGIVFSVVGVMLIFAKESFIRFNNG